MYKNRRNSGINKPNKALLFTILFIISLLLCACEGDFQTLREENVNKDSQVSTEQELSADRQDPDSEDESTEPAETSEENDGEEEAEVEESAGDETSDFEFSLASIPEYSGEAFVTVNDNTPTFTGAELSAEVYEFYSSLDAKGRCGFAMAMIGKELLPTEERGEIGSVKPSGWHTAKYGDLIDGNYLYNRCHLLAYELTGENANEKNLITGTRYMNVQGMLPFENYITDYVKSTGTKVLYRVTPIFEGDDLVARGVWMEAESVGNEGICFSVFCYNVQPGVAIDYATGDSWEDDTYSAYIGNTTGAVDTVASGGSCYAGEYTQAGETTDSQTEENGNFDASEAFVDSIESYDYVVNTNTGKFHLPGCSSVDKIAENNKKYYQGSKEALEAAGYSPCNNCIGN